MLKVKLEGNEGGREGGMREGGVVKKRLQICCQDEEHFVRGCSGSMKEEMGGAGDSAERKLGFLA
jgi:hypothetical protein